MSSDGRRGPAQVSFGIGLYTGQQRPSERRHHYSDAVPLARAAEAAGFDVFWASEHHGLVDGYLPAPLVLLAAVAAATTTIELGAGVVVGPLCHPVRLAEEASVVDNLSGGRLLLGLGAGYLPHEFALYGVDPTQRGARLDELVQVLRRCWRAEPFSWHGEHFSFNDALVTPAPVRDGGIPIWLGGYAPGALDRAGRDADGHLVGRGDPDLVAASAARLRASLAGEYRPFTFGVNLSVVLTDPGGNAESALAGFATQQATYEQIQAGTDVYAGRIGGQPVADGGLALGAITRYVHHLGSAADLVDGLTAVLDGLAGWSRVHLALRALFPDEELGAQLERVERLGAEVVAPLRRHLTVSTPAPTNEAPTHEAPTREAR